MRDRRQADNHLRTTGKLPPRWSWRAAELTSPRERRILARSLRDVAEMAQHESVSLSVIPLNRARVRAHVSELELIADELDALDRRVAPAGVLLVRDLLSNGGSPLYLAGDIEDFEAAVTRIRLALAGEDGRQLLGVSARAISGVTDDRRVSTGDGLAAVKLAEGGR